MSDTRLARPAKSDSTLAAAHPLARLVAPFRTLSLGTQTIYYLLKIGAKSGSARRLEPEVARQVAMLTLNHTAEPTFNLHWYPSGEEPQIHMGLPMTDLAQACLDLSQAGFGRTDPAAGPTDPQIAPKQAAIACNRGSQTLSLPA